MRGGRGMHERKMLLVLTFTGFLALAVVMGIGRFAYTPILPYMEESHLTTFQAGLLASANYAGYLAGAFAAAKMNKSVLLLHVMILISIVTTAAMGFTYSQPWWFGLRFVSGAAGGIAFVLVSSLVLAQVRRKSSSPYYAAFLYGGVGFGIFLSGMFLPPVLALFGGWEYAWIILGVVSALFFILILLGFRPQYTGKEKQEGRIRRMTRHEKQQLQRLYISYFCQGFGYIIFATFIISMVVSTTDMGWSSPYVWAAAGLGALPSAFFWAWIGKITSLLTSLRAAYIVQLAGLLIPVFTSQEIWILVSAFCFGGTFMGITMMTLSFADQSFPRQSQRAIGNLTGLYGIGQLLGPVAAAALLIFAPFAVVFLLAAVFIGAGLYQLQRLASKQKEVKTRAVR
ncbi:MAG: YbfB/YjiJ family MFS transporter [Alkalicoccus sp.]|nr:MAG: YbfB/YjiJ family MFS transporter [Alkalicoccus sp.]